MLASRFGAPPYTLDMADDTMEISSDHGHNIGDEDIDIDIDFTTGQVDEDYVLEDAASNVGFGDNILPQPSPAVGHDDMMTDEYEESFPVLIGGEEFMGDEDGHSMVHEPLDVSFTAANVPTVLLDGDFVESTTHSVADGEMKEAEATWETIDDPEQVHVGAGDIEESEVTWETNDKPAPTGHGSDVHLEVPDEEDSFTVEEVEDTERSAHMKDIETPVANPPKSPRSNSPRSINLNGRAADQESRSQVANSAVPIPGSQDKGLEHADEAVDTYSNSPDIASAIESNKAEVRFASPIPDVLVVYQDSEYSLFSKSETDDIDSYFLSDLSIKDEPLAKFFEAIRHVIHDDISDDDELCLSVGDLELAMEEMSSLTGSVTIGQIINLHEKLMKNDRDNSFGPLCLLLGTRPKLPSRFAYLNSRAAEGKGLFELVEWDEHSEGFDESAHITDNEHEEGQEAAAVDQVGEGDEVHEETEAQESDSNQQETSEILGHETAAQHARPEEAVGVGKDELSSISTTNGNATNGSIAKLSPDEKVLSSQKNGTADGAYDEEEEDLIDYSDEEAQQPSELRKDAQLRTTKLETDDNRTRNAKYEAINEDLRRRSTSRTVEEKLFEQDADTNKFVDHNDGDDFETEEDHLEYGENDGQKLGWSNITAEHEDQSTDYGERGTDHPHFQEDDFFNGDGDTDGGEILEGHDPRSEPSVGATKESFDEVDFGHDEMQQHQELADVDNQETLYHDGPNGDNPTNEQTDPLTKDTLTAESSVGYIDAAGSESAASERTLEAQSVSVGELQTEDKKDELVEVDEIDYDDDYDELNTIEVQQPAVKELQTLSSGSVKRQRTDEDAADTGSQDAKRARS